MISWPGAGGKGPHSRGHAPWVELAWPLTVRPSTWTWTWCFITAHASKLAHRSDGTPTSFTHRSKPFRVLDVLFLSWRWYHSSLMCRWLKAQTDGFYSSAYFPEVSVILTGAEYDMFYFFYQCKGLYVCGASQWGAAQIPCSQATRVSWNHSEWRRWSRVLNLLMLVITSHSSLLASGSLMNYCKCFVSMSFTSVCFPAGANKHIFARTLTAEHFHTPPAFYRDVLWPGILPISVLGCVSFPRLWLSVWFSVSVPPLMSFQRRRPDCPGGCPRHCHDNWASLPANRPHSWENGMLTHTKPHWGSMTRSSPKGLGVTSPWRLCDMLCLILFSTSHEAQHDNEITLVTEEVIERQWNEEDIILWPWFIFYIHITFSVQYFLSSSH